MQRHHPNVKALRELGRAMRIDGVDDVLMIGEKMCREAVKSGKPAQFPLQD